ncbi:MAG: enoyl-CoA hydratase-related protein [Candidatus Eisenbacteria bacterium]
MELKHVQVEPRADWWECTVSRPEAMNALNDGLLKDLEALVGAARNDTKLRGLIVTGAGEKAFVAGADIKELADLDTEGAATYARRGQALFNAIESLDKPVIAAVNGFALGGGCELALACHIRVLAKTAKVGLPEVSLGVIPGYGGTQRLARLVGLGRAIELIATGDPITAEEAHRIGLANRVAEPAELMEVCRSIAARINLRGPRAVADALAAVIRGRDLSMREALALEADHFGRLAATHDWREGTHAFLEKRKPAFTGA